MLLLLVLLLVPLGVRRATSRVSARRQGGPAPAAGPQQGAAAPAPARGPTASAWVQQLPQQVEQRRATPMPLAAACLWALPGKRRAAGPLPGLLLLLLLWAWVVLRKGALMV